MGRQKRKEYAFYAVLAGTFLLIAGAYGSGEKSVQQNAKEMGAVAEKAVADRQCKRTAASAFSDHQTEDRNFDG